MFKKIKAFLFENTSAKQTVAKNTVWLSISNFGGRLIKAGVIIYAARVLGTDGYGVFSYAVTLAGFLSLFVDPGVNSILMRNVAKAGEEERRALFSTTFAIKAVLLLIGVAIVAFIAPFFTTLPGAKALLPVVALILGLDTIREFFFSLIRAMEQMQWEASIFLLTNFGILVFGFLFLRLATNAGSFAWGYVAGDAVGTIAATIVLRRYFKKMFSYFSSGLVLPILRSAWPFAISGAFGLLFTNTDILIISWMRSASDVGIYSAAIRILQTLYLVPAIVQLSTLPLLSRLAKKEDARFRAALERTLGIMFFASIPLSVGGIVLGTPIMGFIFGAPYRAGGLAFEILMATLMFDFSASIIISALFAYDHQKSLIVSSALGGAINVLLDLLLIPRFGISGSAVATLVAQAANNWYLWHMMKKVNNFSLIPRLKKVIIASAIMGCFAWLFLFLGLHVIVIVALCVVIYFVTLKLINDPILKEAVGLLPFSAQKAIS